MKILFWLSLAATAYVYVGYLVVLAVYARIRRRPVMARAIYPSVSILMAVHNEEARLPGKLANLVELQYPAELLQIVVVSDGSTDRSTAILSEWRERITPVILDRAAGKASALNCAVERAQGEILVFLDARQQVDPNAVAELVSCFADPEIGAVSGELILQSAVGSRSEDALGIYWTIEKAVRRLESATGSVVGVTGAIYAIRRELYTEMPPGTILDDVFVPMHIARDGKRVIFQPSAIARDQIFSRPGKEFARKARTLTGNYQLVQVAPWLLSARNPILFRFVSHKMLRLVVPLFLVSMLVSSAAAGGFLYETIFVLQILLYAAAVLGAFVPASKRVKPVAVANTFAMLNVAAVVAFYNFVAGRENVWT